MQKGMKKGVWNPIEYIDANVTSFPLPNKLAKDVEKDQNSIKAIDKLLFVKSDIILKSKGKKEILDVYVQSKTGELKKVNSTLRNMNNDYTIEDFAVISHRIKGIKQKIFKQLQIQVDFGSGDSWDVMVIHTCVEYTNEGSVIKEFYVEYHCDLIKALRM